jgi:quercetin dioxygenase-like cupin family protein
MSTQHALTGQEPFVLDASDGAHFHFLNNAATIKVAAGATGTMSVVEFAAPWGFGPPQHTHEDEDELFIVLEGELSFLMGGTRIGGAAGAYAFLPKGISHAFQVVSDTARFVNVTASATAAPRFDQMVAALGTPTATPEIPEPTHIDPARVAEVCRRFGIEIVGPPPPGLT